MSNVFNYYYVTADIEKPDSVEAGRLVTTRGVQPRQCELYTEYITAEHGL